MALIGWMFCFLMLGGVTLGWFLSAADRMLAKKLREKAVVIRTLVVALEELKDGRSR